jgi:hypothetical protein
VAVSVIEMVPVTDPCSIDVSAHCVHVCRGRLITLHEYFP